MPSVKVILYIFKISLQCVPGIHRPGSACLVYAVLMAAKDMRLMSVLFPVILYSAPV